MTFQSNDLVELGPRERADYGFARVRDLAFDAVRNLWRRRQESGMKQIDLAHEIGRDPAWVSRNLSAPGNWTLRTIGELVEGLNGEIEIIVRGSEDLAPRQNADAYSEYEDGVPRGQSKAFEDSGQVVGDDQGASPDAPMPARGLDEAAQVIS